MLIEVKAKVTWVVDNKSKRATETFILNKEVFAQAEYTVMNELTQKVNAGLATDYDIVNLRVSAVREVVTQYEGEYSYIVSLRDTMLQDDGTEKVIKYKVLLWATSITEAMSHAREIVAQGYDMQIDSLREVNYTYLNNQEEIENESQAD